MSKHENNDRPGRPSPDDDPKTPSAGRVSPAPNEGSDDEANTAAHSARNDATRTRTAGRIDPLRAAWEDDYLVQLAARAELRRADSPFYTDPALVAWIDRESRAPERSVAFGWDAAKVSRVAERVRERAEAARLRVAVPTTPAPLRPADVVGTVPQVREAAAAVHCAPAIDLAAAAGVGRALWDEPCDQWLALPVDVDAGEYVALRVSGDSMEPLFRTGDTILVRLGQRVERDTVVVARHPQDGYVVKRVGRVGRTSLELTSLNAASPPVTIPRDANAVVGTVLMRWRGTAAAAAPT